MSNPFYTASGNPLPQSRGLSSQVKNEFAAIQSGFDKLPSFTANYIVAVNVAGTALEAITPVEMRRYIG